MGIRIGTAERDSTFLSQGNALKTVLERAPTLAPIDVSTSGAASVENANRLEKSDIDFGFMASNWIGRAKNGEAPFTHPIDLRMVAPMNAGPLFFITRADSALRKVSDVRGKRLVVGPQMSGMTQHARVILGTLGLSFADFTPLYLDFAAGADALARGEVDAQLQCPIPNKVMTALAERSSIRVLPYGPGELEKVLAAVPFYRRTIMRKGAIRGTRCRYTASCRRQRVGDARPCRRRQGPGRHVRHSGRTRRVAATERAVQRADRFVRAFAIGGRGSVRIRRRRTPSRRSRRLSGGSPAGVTSPGRPS